MFKLPQVLLQSYNGSEFYSTHIWEIIAMLLGAAVIGYLIRYFTNKNKVEEPVKNVVSTAPQTNEWEVKYKSFHANYEQNKLEWQNKLKSSEDRAKTFQAQVVDMKLLYEKAGTEKADWASKLRIMEGQRNEALEEIKKLSIQMADTVEKSKVQQEKIGSLSTALVAASNTKIEIPKPIIISDEELTKKYEADTATFKKQVDEKDKRIISLLSKEAAANELQLRNDKLATENKILRNEMGASNIDSDAVIARAQKQKELELNIIALSNKAVVAANETALLKKQLADQQTKHHTQANKLNELRMAIGRERNTMKAKIEELEAELAPFKPAAPVVTVPETEQTEEKVEPILAPEVEAPNNEQIEVPSPEVDTTPIQVSVPELPKMEFSTAYSEPIVEVAEPEMEIENPSIEPITTTKDATTPVGELDDLEVVEGIGPKVKQLLKQEGIDTWAKLAAAKPFALKNLLTVQNDANFHTISPNSWPIQAQLLADEKWDAFKAYSSYLIGGVDPDEVRDATVTSSL